MIMVDIYFPAVDLVYDVRVDEQSRINSILKEVGEMMCKKYRSEFTSTSEYMLCSMDIGEILDENKTLASYHIKNGGRLMVV